MLMVYVDDFLMAGPDKPLEKGWELIKQGLRLDTPGEIGRCLGCHHTQRKAKVAGKDVEVMEFVVTDFMTACVDAYKKACGEPNMKLKPVDTPFLPFPEGGGDAPAPLEEGGTPRTLAPVAASVLMKILYGARAARWDLLKAVQLLASRITKWSRDCDRALHRLVCYINSTHDWVLRGFIGDDPSAMRLHLYADADFAGDRPGYKNTSGCFLTLSGPNTCFPLGAKCQRQTAVAHSTPEAEIVSANHAVRTVGLPSLDLWEGVLHRSVVLLLLEDNESTFQIIKTGRNPTMRHITRTHGVNVSWLHDLYQKGAFQMMYTRTESQCADIFTKSFRDALKWSEAVRLIGVTRPGSQPEMPPEPGRRPGPKPPPTSDKSTVDRN